MFNTYQEVNIYLLEQGRGVSIARAAYRGNRQAQQIVRLMTHAKRYNAPELLDALAAALERWEVKNAHH